MSCCSFFWTCVLSQMLDFLFTSSFIYSGKQRLHTHLHLGCSIKVSGVCGLHLHYSRLSSQICCWHNVDQTWGRVHVKIRSLSWQTVDQLTLITDVRVWGLEEMKEWWRKKKKKNLKMCQNLNKSSCFTLVFRQWHVPAMFSPYYCWVFVFLFCSVRKWISACRLSQMDSITAQLHKIVSCCWMNKRKMWEMQNSKRYFNVYDVGVYCIRKCWETK